MHSTKRIGYIIVIHCLKKYGTRLLIMYPAKCRLSDGQTDPWRQNTPR